jgi:hypothetical protein
MTTGTLTEQSGNSTPGVLLRIFPRQMDNNFRGHRLALWLFGLFVLIRLPIGFKSVFDSYATATTADGIPLNSYGAAAAQTVVQMFALLGLNVLVLPALGVIALIRYRAMIPMMYLMMLALALGSRAIHFAYPDVSAGGVQPIGFYVNLGLLAVLLLGFALSVTWSASPAQKDAKCVPRSCG